MAISRHDPEWKRVVFMALAGGVTFHRTVSKYSHAHRIIWYAYLNDRVATACQAGSKFDAALAAISLMGAKIDLPDAAKTRPGAPGKN